MCLIVRESVVHSNDRFLRVNGLDSCDSVSTNTETARNEFDANTRTAVSLATSFKHSVDPDGETSISRFSCAWHTAEPCVISAARDTKYTAERRD
jgi:hypothetical protein